MDYQNISFTEEEKDMLKQHKDTILKWITENISAKLGDEACIRIKFCDGNYYLNVFPTQKNRHYMGNYSATVSYKTGHDFTNRPLAMVCATQTIFAMVDNWQEIKSELLNQLEEMQKAKASIQSFTV